MSLKLLRQDGMTLTEVLVATTLAMVVLFGIVATDVARFRMGEDIRKRSSVISPERGNAALAVIHLAKHLERADRLDLGATVAGLYQFRSPSPIGCTQATLPGCLDAAANYDWDQYRLNGTQLEFNTDRGASGCVGWTTISRQIVGFTVQYKDESTVGPPGPEPLPGNEDNNMAEFTIQWSDPSTGLSQTFRGEVASRASAYTNAPNALAPTSPLTVSPPPAAACP